MSDGVAARSGFRVPVARDGPRAEVREGLLSLLAAPENGAGPPGPRFDRRESDEADYESSIDSAWSGLEGRLSERARARERSEKQAQRLDEIRRVSPAEAASQASLFSERLDPQLVQALVARCDQLSLEDPSEAVGLARLAVAYVEAKRSPESPTEELDLEALALRALAEAHYRSGELVESERAVLAARRAFDAGTLAPALAGDLARVEAAIRSDQSRFTEARKLAERAVRLFRRAGERTSEARATVSLALRWYYDGHLERALATTDRALAMLDPERDGRLRLAAEFNRAFWWNDAGRTAEARAALPALAALAAREGGESDRLRLAWLDARIVAREGDLPRAVELYEQVLARGLELDVVYDSATIAFELAIHLLELGRASEVLPIAESVSRIFSSQGVEPEAGAALLLAAEALRQGAAVGEALRLLRERDRRRPAR